MIDFCKDLNITSHSDMNLLFTALIKQISILFHPIFYGHLTYSIKGVACAHKFQILEMSLRGLWTSQSHAKISVFINVYMM